MNSMTGESVPISNSCRVRHTNIVMSLLPTPHLSLVTAPVIYYDHSTYPHCYIIFKKTKLLLKTYFENAQISVLLLKGPIPGNVQTE